MVLYLCGRGVRCVGVVLVLLLSQTMWGSISLTIVLFVDWATTESERCVTALYSVRRILLRSLVCSAICCLLLCAHCACAMCYPYTRLHTINYGQLKTWPSRNIIQNLKHCFFRVAISILAMLKYPFSTRLTAPPHSTVFQLVSNTMVSSPSATSHLFLYVPFVTDIIVMKNTIIYWQLVQLGHLSLEKRKETVVDISNLGCINICD